jgi:parallel beta-helix repeat protein
MAIRRRLLRFRRRVRLLRAAVQRLVRPVFARRRAKTAGRNLVIAILLAICLHFFHVVGQSVLGGVGTGLAIFILIDALSIGSSVGLPIAVFTVVMLLPPFIPKVGKDFYGTVAQVIPVLLVAFAIEGRGLRRNANVAERILAAELTSGLAVAELITLLAVAQASNPGAAPLPTWYLRVVAAGLAAGTAAVVVLAFIAEPDKRSGDIIVDRSGGGDFTTIRRALRAAAPGATIFVAGGQYRESVVLTTPNVTIAGRGADPSGVLVRSRRGHTVFFHTRCGKVTNVTIEDSGNRFLGDSAVTVAGGGLELTGCVILSSAYSAITIHEGGRPTITRNEIRGSREGGGIFVYNGGGGTIEDNDIYDNELSGIGIKSDADPVIKNNRIYGSREGSGIFVHDGGRGTIENNDIYDNQLGGIEINSDAGTIVKNNRIYGSREGSGIFVYDGGRGTIENNDIYDNELSGIEITSDADPVIKNNRIYGSREGGGILVSDGGRGSIEDNDIHDNELAGVTIGSAGRLVLINNRIHAGRTEGAIMLLEDSGGTISNNDVYDDRIFHGEPLTVVEFVNAHNRLHLTHGRASEVSATDSSSRTTAK